MCQTCVVRPMWTGSRELDPAIAPPSMRPAWLAALLLAIAAAGVYWLVAVYPKG